MKKLDSALTVLYIQDPTYPDGIPREKFWLPQAI